MPPVQVLSPVAFVTALQPEKHSDTAAQTQGVDYFRRQVLGPAAHPVRQADISPVRLREIEKPLLAY